MKTATITSAVGRFAVLMGAFLVIAAGSAFGDTVTLENTFPRAMLPIQANTAGSM